LVIGGHDHMVSHPQRGDALVHPDDEWFASKEAQRFAG
jgi:hypothetical protein